MEIKEIKTTELEEKISHIDVSAQVLHADIKELAGELKMLIIQWPTEESKKHEDKEQSKVFASYSSSQLKDEEVVMPYVFSSTEEQEETLVDIDKWQLKITPAPIPEQKTHTLMSYIPPHKKFRASYIKKDKNYRLKYKTHKTVPNHNHHSKNKTKK